ncbi:SagB/ThcOx family dehydrogenase [Pseudomonas putida]
MSIPHDYYLKFIDPAVMEETLRFHSKGNYVIHKTTQHLSILHAIPENELFLLTGNELKLNPFSAERAGDIDSMPILDTKHHLKRNDSCEKFVKRSMDYATVKKILSPLLKKSERASKRGYPSGGALYPVEVFCCNLNDQITGWPSVSHTLHLLSNSRELEDYFPATEHKDIKQKLLPSPFDLGSPSLALIYCIYLPKAIFKYRYRGYRLAHMEAGSMYMLTDLRCKELELDSRLWSGFTDHEVIKGLGLNPGLFLPACIQFIG